MATTSLCIITGVSLLLCSRLSLVYLHVNNKLTLKKVTKNGSDVSGLPGLCVRPADTSDGLFLINSLFGGEGSLLLCDIELQRRAFWKPFVMQVFTVVHALGQVNHTNLISISLFALDGLFGLPVSQITERRMQLV